jgi:hypothetical protein
MRQDSDALEHPALRPLEVRRVRQGKADGIALVCGLGIGQPTFVPAALLPIVGRCDGVRSTAAIAAEASAQLGEEVPEAFVRELVAQLDAQLVLTSPRFHRAVASAAAEFLASGVRPAAHAGSAGYAADAAQLRRDLAQLVPAPTASLPPLAGLIAPHIDLRRGRDGYAAAYGRLLAGAPADLYVIFGTGHHGARAPVTGLPMDWHTPLGVAPTDRAFVQAVHARVGASEPHDQLLHRGEHSLEFQVLFLQHLAERRGSAGVQVACFLCGALPSASGDPGDEAYAQRLLQAFRGAAAASGKRVCFVAGADLAHLGPSFGDADGIDDVRLQQLRRDEQQRLAHLQAGAPGMFHAALASDDNKDRICSMTSMWLVSSLAGGPGELLHYGQAAAPDGSQVVSFCAMAFSG